MEMPDINSKNVGMADYFVLTRTLLTEALHKVSAMEKQLSELDKQQALLQKSVDDMEKDGDIASKKILELTDAQRRLDTQQKDIDTLTKALEELRGSLRVFISGEGVQDLPQLLQRLSSLEGGLKMQSAKEAFIESAKRNWLSLLAFGVALATLIYNIYSKGIGPTP